MQYSTCKSSLMEDEIVRGGSTCISNRPRAGLKRAPNSCIDQGHAFLRPLTILMVWFASAQYRSRIFGSNRVSTVTQSARTAARIGVLLAFTFTLVRHDNSRLLLKDLCAVGDKIHLERKKHLSCRTGKAMMMIFQIDI